MSVSFLASRKKTTDVRDFKRSSWKRWIEVQSRAGRKHYIHFPTINVPVVDNDEIRLYSNRLLPCMAKCMSGRLGR